MMLGTTNIKLYTGVSSYKQFTDHLTVWCEMHTQILQVGVKLHIKKHSGI